MPCGLEGVAARESAGQASGGSGHRLQCSKEAVSEGACGFCLMLLVDSFDVVELPLVDQRLEAVG